LKAVYKWIAIFSARMLLIYVFLFAVYSAISTLNGFYLLNVIEAKITHLVLSPFYSEIILSNNTISGIVVAGSQSRLSVSVADLCIGWFPIAAFASMIIALPKIKKSLKIKCLKIGVPLLFAANIARIILIIIAGAEWGMGAFNFFHLVLIKFDLMILVIILFVYCVKKIITEKEFEKSLSFFKKHEHENRS